MRLTNLFDQEYQQPQAQAGDIFELELNDDTVIETTIAEVDEEGNIALYLDETAINMIEQAGMLTEAAPALVRGALGFAAGGIAAAGTPALVAILGPILGIGVGAAGAYNATKLAMQGADDIWDWAAKKLGGNEHEFAMNHIRAAAAGEDQFTVGSKTYPVTLKKNQINPAIQAVKSVAESRVEEARKANTKTARSEFGQRTKKPTLSPQEQDQKKSESDEAWARLMAYADQQKNKTVEEDQGDALMSALKGLKTWQVVIRNNYYRGKYTDYSGRYYYVLADSADQAREVVLDNADAILQDLLSMKAHNGKKILPRSSAVPITPERIGEIKDGTEHGRMSTAGYKKMFGPNGVVMVKLSGGSVQDVKDSEVTESQEHSPVAQAITRRIMHSRTDLLAKYGPVAIMDAIDSVADWVGDVDEIGSSDVSAWIRDVERALGHEHVDEAKYHGKEVTLGKPVRGGPKKFYVYVRDPSTKNIKKVNFGDPNMRIKKSSPKHRKSFRARHNCANPGPRTKARYWSCRKW